MQIEKLVCSVQQGYTTIQVTFPNSPRLYTYKAPLNFNLRVGDIVVVPASEEFKLVEVIKVHKNPKLLSNEGVVLRWVVQKVDFTNYQNLVESENQLREQLEDVMVKDMQAKALQAFTSSLSSEALEDFKKLTDKLM